MTAMTTASDSPIGRPTRRRGPGKPFQKGENQAAKYAAVRQRMMDEFIADLESAGGRKVSEADRILVERYVALIKSKSSPSLNTALKIRETLTSKYCTNAPGMTLEKYAAVLAKRDAK
jgi:hypothetical protein